MRLAYFCLAVASALAIFTPAVHSQTMLEYGVSAAGGSAMGVAGKGVSDGIDSIFRKLDQQTRDAAESSESRPRPQATREEDSADFTEAGPAAPANRPRANTTAAADPAPDATTMEFGSTTIWNAAATRPEPPALTREDLESVAFGQQREEVVTRLGTPSARVIIPDGGRLQEVYLYNSRQANLGKVTLVDGAVSAVIVR